MMKVVVVAVVPAQISVERVKETVTQIMTATAL